MNPRRVRVAARLVYGRAMPLERPMRRRWQRPGLGLWQRRLMLLLVLVGAVVWWLWQSFRLTQVTVTAASRGGEIRAEAEKILSESWWQRNLLTLDSEALV